MAQKTYIYECRGCSEVAVHTMEADGFGPDAIDCTCGESVPWTRVTWGEDQADAGSGIQIIVQGKCWDIPHDKRTMPVGWQHGNTDHEAQERRYAKNQQALAKRAHELKRSGGHREDMRLAGQVPRELFLARQRQYGRDYWQNEGKAALRREGLLLPGAD